MTRKEFDEFDRVEDMISKPTTPSTIRTFIDGSVTEQNTSSTTSVSSSTTLGSGYPFTDSGAFWTSFHQYRKTLTQSLQYAIERLNQKGVYSNVITFCAKILALCFFKLPGVAFGLLHALPASRSYVSRVAKAMNIARENSGMPQIMNFFPDHLSSICFEGSGSWWREFEKQKRRMATGESTPPMEMFGNWVRRWQSDDSELFFAFYRHYHHCLAQYLEAPLHRLQAGGWATSAIAPKVYAGAPGYLYLSAFFLTKIEGLVHREIHPVTTIVQFEPNSGNGANGAVDRDRAMASVATGEFPGTAAPPAVKLSNGSDGNNNNSDDRKDNNNNSNNNNNNGAQSATGKPKVLDMASRRFVETIVAIMEDHGNIYGAMLDIWIKAVVTKTSVYDVESVFCLLDFLDMLIAELESRESIRLYDSELSSVPLNSGPSSIFVPIHVQFILTTLHLLLSSSDHTVTLMRTISFIYQNFSLLTGTIQSLEQLTLGTLLSPPIFEKCYLHWARNVRLYYMRCLVWKVARIGGGVGILPGWKPWVASLQAKAQQQQQQQAEAQSQQRAPESLGGVMAMSTPSHNEPSHSKKKTKDIPVMFPKATPLELSLNLIVSGVQKNIFEVMENRIDMVKRQYAGELSDVISPRMSAHDLESTTGPEESTTPLSRSPRLCPDDGTALTTAATTAAARSFYEMQARQIYVSQQKLTLSSGSLKEEENSGKDKSKKTASRSSIISRKFKRLSRSDNNSNGSGTIVPPEQSHRNSLPDLTDPSLYDSSSLFSLASSGGSSQSSGNSRSSGNSSKRNSTGSLPITGPGSLFRWMFQSSSSSKLSALAGSCSSPDLVGGHRHGEKFSSMSTSSTSSMSTHSLLTQSTGSSTSLSLLMNNCEHHASSDIYRRDSGGSHNSSRSASHQHGSDGAELDHRLGYQFESRKYPEHLTTYAGRSIPEHSAVLNEYVDWLSQCHSYGIKSRAGFVVNGLGHSHTGMAGAPPMSQPGMMGGASSAAAATTIGGGGGGVQGLGIGTLSSGPGNELFGDFSVFSLGIGGVVDASAIAGHHDEWISPGMAQMMMLRFPGLVVEWPKFWNNSREASGPPPGPITTLSALAVVNNPALSLGKGNAGGVGGGVSAGAGGPFGGASLSASYGASSNGPSSLRHQQQAQMHHQQQMQLWSRNAAAAAAAAAANANNATSAMANSASSGIPESSGVVPLSGSNMTNNTSKA
ncbi:hypothetical protein BG004_002500 [Podila humilis]|nr:hypothetical protein BG004_002500 [Podila humilis]